MTKLLDTSKWNPPPQWGGSDNAPWGCLYQEMGDYPPLGDPGKIPAKA